MYGLGVALKRVRVLFLFHAQCGLVLSQPLKKLNKRVSSSVWVEYCCLLHYHRLLPLPPSSYSKYDQEEGVEGRKAKRGRMNESLNELYCVSGHACSS